MPAYTPSKPAVTRIGQRLREERVARNLSQIDLAQRAQLSPVTVNHFEHGHIWCKPATFKKLVVGLEIGADSSAYRALEKQWRAELDERSQPRHVDYTELVARLKALRPPQQLLIARLVQEPTLLRVAKAVVDAIDHNEDPSG